MASIVCLLLLHPASTVCLLLLHPLWCLYIDDKSLGLEGGDVLFPKSSHDAWPACVCSPCLCFNHSCATVPHPPLRHAAVGVCYRAEGTEVVLPKPPKGHYLCTECNARFAVLYVQWAFGAVWICAPPAPFA